MNYEEALLHMRNRIGMTVLTSIADDNMMDCIAFIKKETSCDDNTAKLIWCDLKMDYGTKENNPILQARENYEKEKQIEEFQYRNNAECPYCHSKNTTKITTTAKAVNIALFGLLGNKRKHQWHCDNCKSDF